jgi:alkaline phosphatase
MKKMVFSLLGLFLILNVHAQDSTPSLVHSHNDYEKPEPFYKAYEHKVASIEADIFARDGRLLVAHTAEETDVNRTLESLYLDPLRKMIEKNGGHVYGDASRSLILLIDLKSRGDETMDELVLHMTKYPSLINCSTLKIVISGDVPDTSRWSQYPSYIFFDGRPQIQYNINSLKRILMISDSFGRYVRTTSKGEVAPDTLKIVSVIEQAENNGKLFRFWGTPDTEEMWAKLLSWGVDLISTDNVDELCAYLDGT